MIFIAFPVCESDDDEIDKDRTLERMGEVLWDCDKNRLPPGTYYFSNNEHGQCSQRWVQLMCGSISDLCGYVSGIRGNVSKRVNSCEVLVGESYMGRCM